jgi:aarF domain-containing kinase
MAVRLLGRVGLAGGAAGGGYVLIDTDRRDGVVGFAKGTTRFGRAMYYSASAAADWKMTMKGLQRGTEEYETKRMEVHERAAEKLLHVCIEHGGVYTKFGQHVASMNHIMPKPYTERLKVLQDRNPSVSLEEVRRAIRTELGADISELFKEFDEKAIAAASLAQVHRAVKMTGEEVAVKLQYPGLEQQVTRDMMTMRLLATAMGIVFPDYEYTWLFPEFEESIGLELDFIQEATNGERLSRMLSNRNDIVVPAIHWDYTTRRVLTMEYIHGTKITDVDNMKRQGIDPVRVAQTVGAAFGDMIFYHGFVHCDPHPGNLFVRPHPSSGKGRKRGRTEHQVVLLDHGMVRRLDSKFRLTYCRLWKSFLTRDLKLGRQTAADLGLAPDMYDALSLIITWRPAVTRASLGKRVTEDERRALRDKYRKILSAESVNAFLEALPRDMLFVLRTGDLIRGLNKDLGGTSRQRLTTMGQAAIRGLSLPNAVPNKFVEAPHNREADFRHFLANAGIACPPELDLAHPQAGVNQLVSSEVGMKASRLAWWSILNLRIRLWVLDAALNALWYMRGDSSFTDRDIG